MNNHARATAPSPAYFSEEVYSPSDIQLYLKNGLKGIPFIERIGGVFAANCQVYAQYLNLVPHIGRRPMDASLLHTVRFIGLVERHYTEPHGAGFYASNLFMTGDNLRKVCRKTTSLPPLHLVNLRRVLNALFLLQGTDRKVQDIACDSGVDNVPYFCMLFKRFTGMTPKEYREQGW